MVLILYEQSIHAWNYTYTISARDLDLRGYQGLAFFKLASLSSSRSRGKTCEVHHDCMLVQWCIDNYCQNVYSFAQATVSRSKKSEESMVRTVEAKCKGPDGRAEPVQDEVAGSRQHAAASNLRTRTSSEICELL
jgi:hypothetical protein